MKNNSIKGGFYAALAYFIWGLFAIYWKSVSVFPPIFLLSFRIVMAFAVIVPILFFTRNSKKLFMGKRNIFYMLLAGLLLGSNWYLYIYAVTTFRVLDASLAYYMTPLITIALGIIILGERKTLFEYTAIIFAAVGVVYRTYTLGSIPFLSIAIGGTFALYGFIKKQTPYNSIQSTMLETAFLVIPSLIYVSLNISHTSEAKAISWFLLSLSGIVTTVPLIFFGKATKLMKISSLGFFQFITPVMTSALGVFLYKEPFQKDTAITFSFIIIGVLLYIISMIMKIRVSNIKQNA